MESRFLLMGLCSNLPYGEDPQKRTSNVEVITMCTVVMLFFGGNIERSRFLLQERGCIPNVLEKSRLVNHRQHSIAGLFLVVSIY
jgi:hypothetical protein